MKKKKREKKLVHCRLGGPERNSERKVLGALGIFLSAGVLVICCCCWSWGNRPFVLLLPNTAQASRCRERSRVRTQKGRRIEGCDAHSFPHRERKNNNKRTRNERRNKQRKNTKHVGRKKNPLAVGRSFLKRRRYRLGHITFFFIDKYQ